MTDRKPIAAAVKLMKDAEAAGLQAVEKYDGTFRVVIVLDKATGHHMTAEWWDGSLVREFNYATVATLGEKRARRASSLKAARAHVGL